MPFSSWRGTVGQINPTHRPGPLEEKIRLLAEGIGVVPVTVGFTEGNQKEFADKVLAIEEKVAELAEVGVDLITPGGAPPTMVHGWDGERRIVEDWEDRFGTPVVTTAMTQVLAMRALGVETIVGITYFPGGINDIFSAYFEAAGIRVLAMEGMDVPFDKVQSLSSHEVYAHAKAAFRKNPTADMLYMMGGGWRVLDIVELLEEDLEIPVLHTVPAWVWYVQRHFMVGERKNGFGRLLSEFPRLPILA